MLHKAGAKAIPKYREIKSLKTCGKGIWNSKISQKSKEAKRANWQWKNSKKTNSNSDSEKKEMVRRKRELRQLQRQAHASKKDNMISDIMFPLPHVFSDFIFLYFGIAFAPDDSYKGKLMPQKRII
jgi:hypothetical protein